MASGFFTGKKILVTGATGSIGSEIVRQIQKQDPAVIRLFSRDEHKQFIFRQETDKPENLRFLLGDVRDFPRLLTAMEGIDYVFHAAAYKHVPFCEYNAFEAVKTNVLGTQNVIDASIRHGVKRVLLVSTDKAASPPNVMGATKLLAEKLMSSAMALKGSHPTLFASVRFGNVFGSRGSVVPTLFQQIKKGGPVTVTDPTMTRFFLSIPDAVRLTFTAMEQMNGGELFILKMPVMKLGELVDVLIERSANMLGKDAKSIKQHVIGARPGEKLQELLMTSEESQYAEEKNDMFIVRSPLEPPNTAIDMEEPRRLAAKPFSSADVPPLSKDKIAAFVDSFLITCTESPATLRG
jgi:FlaA1/EpsC-like NDP-sugar epimerase